jgi:Lrp/AsnC family transcriptional regulator, leucine-responsive regulatory protein
LTVDLDDLDRELLSLLIADGRTPVAQIADRIGLSRPAVADRLAKLERLGVIRGITAVIDPAALGRSVTAFITARTSGFTNAAAKRFDQLMLREEILEAHTVAGEDCYLLKVRTDSIGSLNALIQELSNPPLSLVTRTTIVMETHCEKVGGVDLARNGAEK